MKKPTPLQLTAWIIVTVILTGAGFFFTPWPAIAFLPVAWLIWVLNRRRDGIGPGAQ